MLTPIRFRDSDDPLARELLASAEQDRAPSASRAKVALGLGLGALASNAAPASLGVAKGTPARLLRLRLVALQKYMLVGLATGLAAVAGWRLTVPTRSEAPVQLIQPPPSAASVADTPAPQPPSAAPEPAAIERAVTPATPVARQHEAAQTEALRRPAPPSAQRPPVRSSAAASAGAPRQSDTLLAEVAHLDRARAALRDQHAAQAISELDAYAAAFPKAELALEAEVLRVNALMAAGQPSAAAVLARRLLDRPGSEQYRAALRRAIAGARR
jgi:hypothetical protein